MCMWMYIHMYIYIHLYTYICIYPYLSTFMYKYIGMYINMIITYVRIFLYDTHTLTLLNTQTHIHPLTQHTMVLHDTYTLTLPNTQTHKHSHTIFLYDSHSPKHTNTPPPTHSTHPPTCRWNDCPITSVVHAAYLGRELQKAELALRNGTAYLQD